MLKGQRASFLLDFSFKSIIHLDEIHLNEIKDKKEVDGMTCLT